MPQLQLSQVDLTALLSIAGIRNFFMIFETRPNVFFSVPKIVYVEFLFFYSSAIFFVAFVPSVCRRWPTRTARSDFRKKKFRFALKQKIFFINRIAQS